MVVMGQLAHLDLQQAHQVYSCFDPNGREKMEFMEFLCCILAVHRPSMNALTSGHYIYARDYIKAIPIVVRGVEVFENGRGGITKHELRKILKSVCVVSQGGGAKGGGNKQSESDRYTRTPHLVSPSFRAILLLPRHPPPASLTLASLAP